MISYRKLSFAIALSISGSTALASGYNFGTQSVAAMSTADASAAEATDPSTIYYNPAGLTHLEGVQLTGNAIFALPNVKVRNAQGFNVDTTPINGTSNETIAKGLTFVPHVYASWQLNPKITLGLGVYVPFGAKTEYSNTSVLRYSVNKTELKTIDINPTIAFRISPQHSFGVGIITQYADANLRKYANFSPALSRATGNVIPNGIADGVADVKADDWGFGFNLGWLWDINDQAKLGISYRSAIKHTLRGTAKWDLVGPAFASPQAVLGVRANGYVAEESAYAHVTTPESLSIHGSYQIDPKVNLFGNLTWTRHSRFNELEIKLANKKPTLGGISDASRIYPKWRDTWRISLGGSYQVSEPLQLRAGISYDQSPIKDPTHRLTTLPDNDRYWLSLGAQYDFSKNSTLNIGYSYMFVKNGHADIEACPGACVDSKATGRADYKSHAHFLGLQYTHRF